MQAKYFYYTSLLLTLLFIMNGCKKKEYALPTVKQVLQNDCIKRSLGPNIVGQNIEFAYAIAIPAQKGTLVSAQVEASIPGAPSTYLENNSYYTNGSGQDIGVQVGSPSVNKGAITEVTFTVDTTASTLRYYYSIPEEARGKTVSFTFSAKSSDGETVSYSMGPYNIAKMDIIHNLVVTDSTACYISISDTAVYNLEEASTHADKVDLVYLYRKDTAVAFNHALVAPATSPQYLPGVVLPSGVNNDTKEIKVFNLQDYDLAHLQYGVYVDDLDFQQIDFSRAPDFAINLKSEAGVWAETADGKYKAYIYINSVNNTKKSAVISMKRYTMK